MLIKDYSRFAAFGSFGAAGHDTGRDCPVPAGTTILGVTTHTAEEHDSWCDCMYADPAINARCKEKAGINPMTWKYIPLPWTVMGKDARALPGSMGFTKLAEQGIKEGAAAIAPGSTPTTQPSGGGTIKPFTYPTMNTQPATSPDQPWTYSPGSAIDRARGGSVRFVTETLPGGRGRVIGVASGGAAPTSSSNMTTYLGLAAVAAGIVFLATRPKRAPAMGFFPRRRRC